MPAPPKPISPKPACPRTDGRRTLLVYLDGDLIKDLKKVALDEERNVYEIVEQASREWLAQRGRSAPGKKGPSSGRGAKRTGKKGAST